jgi:ABC-type lipoprotein export system ATPase subunit
MNGTAIPNAAEAPDLAAAPGRAEALAMLIGDTTLAGEPDSTHQGVEAGRTNPVQPAVSSITILSGRDKSGVPEEYDSFTIRNGEVICIVGATGSGKSRLLADIEWLAQGDTLTGRSILINGGVPDLESRYAGTGRLVAQLSQNMNFVMDATVGEFLELHGESRGIAVNREDLDMVIDAANRLTGEPISAERQLTELSGGQSRALMIADTALLSSSPIVLIDEIENAGINRHEAIAVLTGADKIVLIATHDPSLALSAPRRLVIANGGIATVRSRTAAEEQLAGHLRELDAYQEELRREIRAGAALDQFAGRL